MQVQLTSVKLVKNLKERVITWMNTHCVSYQRLFLLSLKPWGVGLVLSWSIELVTETTLDLASFRQTIFTVIFLLRQSPRFQHSELSDLPSIDDLTYNKIVNDPLHIP